MPEALEEVPSIEGAAVDIQAITKIFRRQGEPTLALDTVDLAIKPAEFVCLLGPSGCGKSTLLNVVAGFLRPDAGAILVDGDPVSGPGADRCMLFQSPTLFPWLTARDNVLFGPRAQRTLSGRAVRRADELLDIVGLRGFEDHYPHQLSGGMRHRAAFARALINQPPILLMDEPFAALDAITRASMQVFLLGLWEQLKMTILFVTHDVEEATLLADRVCVMSPRPGRIMTITDITLPRPRTQETMDTSEFIALRRRLRQQLGGTGG